MKTANANNGFTLVEIAIVLVIIGLLLGGILKGQEPINNAKVRAIADRQSSLKVAWFAFIDRFGALPGDYVHAHIHITGAAPGDGDAIIGEGEQAPVFQHLAAAGYLRCGHCTETGTGAAGLAKARNSPINNYGGVMNIWHDTGFYAIPSTGSLGTFLNVPRLMIRTGPRIPSNILAEVDRKIDDGVPNTGDMRFNEYDPTYTGNMPPAGECTKANAAGTVDGDPIKLSPAMGANFWRPAGAPPPVYQNCGASIMI